MKKLLLIVLIFGISFAFCQEEYLDVVTLKNGSTISGTITEFNLDEALSIQTMDGYEFLFRVTDVDKIHKKPKIKQSSTGNTYSYGQNRSPKQDFGKDQFTTNPNKQQSTPPANWQRTQPSSGQYTNAQPQARPSGYDNSFVNASEYQNTAPPQNSSVPNRYHTDQNQLTNHGGIAYQNPSNSDYSRTRFNSDMLTNANPNYTYPQTPLGNTQHGLEAQKRTNPQTAANYTSLHQGQQLTNPYAFTDIDTYKKEAGAAIDCNQGYGNYTFLNATNSPIIVSLQQKQKDGYFADFREVRINTNAQGYFSNLKVGDYPFVVKIKNKAGGNYTDYVILGRGNARVERCKNQKIRIE